MVSTRDTRIINLPQGPFIMRNEEDSFLNSKDVQDEFKEFEGSKRRMLWDLLVELVKHEKRKDDYAKRYETTQQTP